MCYKHIITFCAWFHSGHTQWKSSENTCLCYWMLSYTVNPVQSVVYCKVVVWFWPATLCLIPSQTYISNISHCSDQHFALQLSVLCLWLASWWQSPSAWRKTGSIVRKLPVNLLLWNRLLLDRESILVVWPRSLFLYLFFNVLLRSGRLVTKTSS